jgi:hypothetical protein
MALFTGSTKSIGSLAASIAEIESEYTALLALKKAKVGGHDLWPASRMAVSVDLFLQVGIRRTAELTEALGRDVTAEAFAPVWSGSRAIMEIAALMLDLTGRAQVCVANPSREEFQELDTHLAKVSLGFKSIEWTYSEDVMAKNILTVVERTSKKQPAPFREALERIGAQGNDFMSAYEIVSEGAHPNYVGTLESYQKPDRQTGECELFDSPAKRDPKRIAIPLNFAAGALLMALSSVRDWEALRDGFIKLLPDYQPEPMPEPRRKQDA